MVAGLITIHGRHHDIQQDDVWRRSGHYDLQNPFTIVGDFDLVQISENPANQSKIVWRIIDYKNRRFLHHAICI